MNIECTETGDFIMLLRYPLRTHAVHCQAIGILPMGIGANSSCLFCHWGTKLVGDSGGSRIWEGGYTVSPPTAVGVWGSAVVRVWSPRSFAILVFWLVFWYEKSNYTR